MKNKLMRVGVIGMGSMGKNHARILSRISSFELVGFWDPHSPPESLENSPKKFDSLQHLLDAHLDYCVVASPTLTHVEIACELILRGTNILVEKPLASTLQGCKEIMATAEKTSVKVGVGHIERFNPAIQIAKDVINANNFGDQLFIDTYRKGPTPNRNLGVGVAIDLMSHDIDTTLWLTGSSYIAINSLSSDSLVKDNEQLSVLQAKLKNGAIVRHQVDWITPKKIRQIRISFANAFLEIDSLNNKVELTRHINGKSTTEIFVTGPSALEPLELEHLEFKKFVLGEESQIADLQQATRVIEVLSKI